MLRIPLWFLAVCWTTAAQAESCKTILDATRRLECYDDAFKVDHLLVDILNNPHVGGPLVTLWIGRKQAAASQTSADAAMLTAKTAGFREIAKLRISWMDTLRNTLAEYHAILMNLEDRESIEAVSEGSTEDK